MPTNEGEFTADEARGIMAVPKGFAGGSRRWATRGNHAGHKDLTISIVDSDGSVMAGLTFTAEIKAPVVVDRCFYLFTLYKLHRSGRRRIYQLEVRPANRRTHIDVAGHIYGPHEHFGCDEVRPVEGLNCEEFDRALTYFCERCSILGNIQLPDHTL